MNNASKANVHMPSVLQRGVVPLFFPVPSTFPSSCRKPLDGYMDLQLSIRIEEMVCELQLNTEKVVFMHHAIGIFSLWLTL